MCTIKLKKKIIIDFVGLTFIYFLVFIIETKNARKFLLQTTSLF